MGLSLRNFDLAVEFTFEHTMPLSFAQLKTS